MHLLIPGLSAGERDPLPVIQVVVSWTQGAATVHFVMGYFYLMENTKPLCAFDCHLIGPQKT